MVFEVILGGVIAGVVGVVTSVFQVNRHFENSEKKKLTDGNVGWTTSLNG